jgi:hypothetical protein
MGLTTAMRVIYGHLYFFRDGVAYTDPTSGTSGRESKPGSNDTGWIDLGVNENIQPDSTQSGEDVLMKGTPGMRREYDVIAISRILNIRFQLQELSALAYEQIFRTEALSSASSQFNPLEGGQLKGWLLIQPYDQNDQALGPITVYGRLQVTSPPTFGAARTTIDMEHKVLHSTLNSGTLS